MTHAFNIRGTNGSGKSSFPLHAYSTDPSASQVTTPDAKYTICPEFGVVTVGHYHNPTGGLDTIKKVAFAVSSIESAADAAEDLGYNLVFEGVILSTMVQKSIEILTSLEVLRGINSTAVFLTTPFETCLGNVLRRNGGKPVSVEGIRGKHRRLQQHVEKFRSAGVHTIEVLPPEGREAWVATVAEAVRPGGTLWDI